MEPQISHVPWSRRDFLGGAALLALALGVSIEAISLFTHRDDAPNESQLAVLARACDLLIPRTDTPGALDSGVPAFVALALAHGLSDSGGPIPSSDSALLDFKRRDGSLNHLAWLETALGHAAGGDFLAKPSLVQERILAALDSAAYPPGPPPPSPPPWQIIKGLILTGYYTSETGASQELGYELVPGRWDPDLPLAQGARAWSSDWTAVEFG